MVFIAELLWGDNWPVAKRESSGADQEAHSLAKFGNKDITPGTVGLFLCYDCMIERRYTGGSNTSPSLYLHGYPAESQRGYEYQS